MSRALRVFVAGEGANELGSMCAEPPFRTPPLVPGVVEALMRALADEAFEVIDGLTWKRIRKYKSGGHASAERRTVLGLALAAKELGADVLAFVRDADADPARSDDIDAAIADVPRVVTGAPPTAGGVAVRSIEAWLLALAGRRGTEAMSGPKLEEELAARHVKFKRTEDYVAFIGTTRRAELSGDADSLRRFQSRVVAAFDAARATSVRPDGRG